jgi:hypothetical protein
MTCLNHRFDKLALRGDIRLTFGNMSFGLAKCLRSSSVTALFPILLCLPLHRWLLWVLAFDPVP